MDALAGVVPGTLLLGQMEPQEQACRVLDARGTGLEGVHKGALLPLGPPSNGSGPGHEAAPGPAPESEPDWEFLGSLGAESCLGMPLETSDGRIVATLSAVDTRRGTYGCREVAMLSVGARLLGHEWEGIERRAELRRLRGRLAESDGVDPETGLLARDDFLQLLDRELRLVQRENVESVLVAFRVGDGAKEGDGAAPIGKLALKTAAEVLEGGARTTDRLGRVGETGLATILTGCKPEQAPTFVARFLASLERVTRGGNARADLGHGIQPLADSSSAEEALMRAETEAAAPALGEAKQGPADLEVRR